MGVVVEGRVHAAHARATLGGEAGLAHALRHTRGLQLGRVPLPAKDLVKVRVGVRVRVRVRVSG